MKEKLPNLGGRPRIVTDKQINDILRLGKKNTPSQIAEILEIKPNRVYFYLKSRGIKPIRVYKTRIKKKKKKLYKRNLSRYKTKPKLVRLNFKEVMVILTEYFGKELRLSSISLFNKPRIERGVCFYILQKHSNSRIEDICENVSIPYKSFKSDIKYAISKNADQMVMEIELKIKNYKDGQTIL